MQIVRSGILCVAIAVAACFSTAFAEVSSRGVATVQYAKKLAAADRDNAIALAKQNAIERYFAGTTVSRQQLFERARQTILASSDLYISNWVVVSEHEEKSSRAFEVVVRADINETKLDLDLAKVSPSLGSQASTVYVAVVFVARTPAEIKSFDERRYQRADVSVSEGQDVDYQSSGKEAEDIRANSIATSDSYSSNSTAQSQMSATVETGGSTVVKASEVFWKVDKVSDIDQTITGVLTDRGMEVVPSEFIDNLDLAAVRDDFGSNDDLAPETLRALVAAVRSNDISMLLLGTLDTELTDQDPISGLPRSHVMVTGRILDVTGRFPKVISSIGPIQFSAIGSTETVARTNAMKDASAEVAAKLVDDYAVRAAQ